MEYNLFKVALLQLVPKELNQEENLKKGIEFCKKAKELEADIALFPEMWNIGYSFFEREDESYIERWKNFAINRDDKFILEYRRLAKELNMAIGITYLEKWNDLPRNTISIIDRFGNIILTYAKVHTCDFDKESKLTPGDDFYVCRLNTKNDSIILGAMICYDREFPESARILMLKGAEIILVPNSCLLEKNRIEQVRTRAFENMVGIAVVNYASPKDNGHSIAFDPVVFDENGNSLDSLVIEAGQEEGIYMAIFDIDKIRDFRKRETWGNAYRKPSKYKILIEETVKEPFIRQDSRRKI